MPCPARSVATISLPAAQTNAAPPESTSGSVPGSRWSRCEWLEVTTSTKERPAGSTTSPVMRSCSTPASSLVSLSESERYGSRRMFSFDICTRKPLCPSHQMCMPRSSVEALISATRSSPERTGSIQSGGSSWKGSLGGRGTGPPERLGMSGRSGSASAALRLNAERSPRRVVGPDGKSASGSLAMVFRGRGRGSRARGDRSQRSDRSNGLQRPSRAYARQAVAAAGWAAAAATTAAAAPIGSRSELTTMSYCVGSSAFSPKNRLR